MGDATCVVCGCSDDRPCFGAAFFASVAEARAVHRLVPDPRVLPAWETCAWVVDDAGNPVAICTAHTEDELADEGIAFDDQDGDGSALEASHG